MGGGGVYCCKHFYVLQLVAILRNTINISNSSYQPIVDFEQARILAKKSVSIQVFVSNVLTSKSPRPSEN